MLLPGHVVLRALRPRRPARGRAPGGRPDRIPAARRTSACAATTSSSPRSRTSSSASAASACGASTCRLAFDPAVLDRLQAPDRRRPLDVRRQRRPARARRGSGAAGARGGRAAARGLRLRRRAARPGLGARPPHTAARRGASTCTGCSRSRASSLNRHIDCRRGQRQQHAPLRGDRRRRAAASPRTRRTCASSSSRARRSSRTTAPTTWWRRRDAARDDGERAPIAAAGQARTLREHTYERRMRELARLARGARSDAEALADRDRRRPVEVDARACRA